MGERKPENADRAVSIVSYVAFGVAVLAAGYLGRTPLTHALYDLESTVERMGIWAPIFLVLVTSVWSILCLPGPVIFGFVGTVYSLRPHWALFVVWLADAVAQAVGFVLARHFGRERARRLLSKKSWYQWLEEQAERRGAYGVFIIRMMPFFPNSLANYAFGLSPLKFVPYLIASVLGSLPNLAVYIYGTAGAIRFVRSGIGTETLHLASVVVVVTIVLLLILQGILRRHGKLANWEPEETES